MATFAVFGGGLVGRRTAAALALVGADEVWLVGQTRTPDPLPGVQVARRNLPERVLPSVAVVATTPEQQVTRCEQLVAMGVPVVSAAGEPEIVRTLWSLGESSRCEVPVVVGAAFAPGLSSLLVAYLMQRFDSTHEVHVASFGTGGPACARAHHRAMSAPATEVRDGRLHRPRSGTGRQLVWFPEPVGGADCYFGGLADPFLMHRIFPTIDRVQARQAATRRDRLTSLLPMLRRPHAEGLLGATVAEVRGVRDGEVEHVALGASVPQATGAAHVAAAMARIVADVGMSPGATSVVAVEDPASVLADLAGKITLWSYDGSTATVGDASTIRAARAWNPRK